MQKRKWTPDRVTRGLMAAVVALLAVIAVGLWDNSTSILPAAHAQIPDTAKQRQLLIVEARRTNELLSQIMAHLQTKAIKVEFDDTDKREGSRASSPTKRK